MTDKDNIRLITNKAEADRRTKRIARYREILARMDDAIAAGHSRRNALAIALFECGAKDYP